jgi:hypothetical protein
MSTPSWSGGPRAAARAPTSSATRPAGSSCGACSPPGCSPGARQDELAAPLRAYGEKVAALEAEHGAKNPLGRPDRDRLISAWPGGGD